MTRDGPAYRSRTSAAPVRRPAPTSIPSTAFEDSVTGTPNPVTCEPDLPEDIYLSAEMPAQEQADVIE